MRKAIKNILYTFSSKIKTSLKIYENNGLIGIINSFFRNIRVNIKFFTDIDNRKKKILKIILLYSKKKIIEGPYKNVKFNYESKWDELYLPSKYLGLYERQIQIKIIELKKKYKLQNIINIGAAEGYHIVSLIKKKIFKNGIAFETDKHSQILLKKNLELNFIKRKVKVFGHANFNILKDSLKNIELKKSLFLFDIEGNEFSFINKKNINFFRDSILIIENHDFFIKNKNIINSFFISIKKLFKIEIVKNNERNPYHFKQLDKVDDDTRWLAMSENRVRNMNWLILTPKKISNVKKKNIYN
jgi:hypothetical protein